MGGGGGVEGIGDTEYRNAAKLAARFYFYGIMGEYNAGKGANGHSPLR